MFHSPRRIGHCTTIDSRSIHLAELVQASLVLIDVLGPFLDELVPSLEDVAMGFEPRVEADHA